MEKINFSGGEPFIVKRGSHLGEMVRYCKETLQLPSVSIISNGSLIQENWFVKYGKYGQTRWGRGRARIADKLIIFFWLRP